MNRSTITLLSTMLLGTGIASSCKGDPVPSMEAKRIKITIGAKSFAATLADNPTASAFKALLPLRLKMSDLHGNEKFFHLPSPLPSADANPGNIQSGDLMLWSSKSVVLFYKSFPTSYRYTRLGRIANPDGLAAAVGTGDVTIRFETE